jgi:thiol-disulfide isomerase/thioredoxin
MATALPIIEIGECTSWRQPERIAAHEPRALCCSHSIYARVRSVSLSCAEDLAGWNMVYGDAAKQDMLYVVEVYAKWCGSSKACLSTYKKLVEEYVEQQKKVRSIHI